MTGVVHFRFKVEPTITEANMFKNNKKEIYKGDMKADENVARLAA